MKGRLSVDAAVPIYVDVYGFFSGQDLENRVIFSAQQHSFSLTR